MGVGIGIHGGDKVTLWKNFDKVEPTLFQMPSMYVQYRYNRRILVPVRTY